MVPSDRRKSVLKPSSSITGETTPSSKKNVRVDDEVGSGSSETEEELVKSADEDEGEVTELRPSETRDADSSRNSRRNSEEQAEDGGKGEDMPAEVVAETTETKVEEAGTSAAKESHPKRLSKVSVEQLWA